MASSTPDFTLDDQLCFAAYSASRALTHAYREKLREVGLTYTQYVVMLLLWEEATLPMGAISAHLHLDSATLSPVLKRMAAEDLLTRRRSTEDERIVEVTITPAGSRLRPAVREIQREVEQATGLAPHELAGLRSELHRVAETLRSATAGQATAEAAATPGR